MSIDKVFLNADRGASFLKKLVFGQKHFVNQRVFKILLIFFSYEVSNYPLSIYGSTLTLGGVK